MIFAKFMSSQPCSMFKGKLHLFQLLFPQFVVLFYKFCIFIRSKSVAVLGLTEITLSMTATDNAQGTHLSKQKKDDQPTPILVQ